MTRLGAVAGLVAGLAVAGLAAAGCAGPPVARGAFQDPVAIAATPDGTVWVVDAGSGEVVAVRQGVVVRRIGGAGTGDDAFLDPVDLDPTNGQTLFVADRAAGAIVRVTAEGRIAESIPVPDVDPAQPVRGPRRTEARGQPVAVAAAPDGGLYVIDGGRGHVLKLDADGAVERVLGAGVLSDSVDLVVADDGTVWIADAGNATVHGFDAFGSMRYPVRAVIGGGRIVGLAVQGDRLAIAQTRVLGRGLGYAPVPRRDGQPDLRGVALLPGGAAVVLTADGVESGDPVLD